jgi:hypothetical protein
MNKWIWSPLLILLVILFYSCTSGGKKADQEGKKPGSCMHKIHAGDIDVCLPEYDGMVECRSNPLMKNKVSLMEFNDIKVLGMYLNDSTFKKMDEIDKIYYEGYFNVYVTRKTEGLTATTRELDLVIEGITNAYEKTEWARYKKQIEERVKSFKLDKPVLLETYSPNEEVRTAVILLKVQNPEKEYYLITTINCMIIKERVVFLAYYRKYEGEASVKDIKSSNDYIVLRFMEENR